jgi:S1/P1 Nuclease/Metal binding domain of Ada
MGQYDQWGADGDLAFLIHFVADLHQPLHAANNQDLGGNCVMVESQVRMRSASSAGGASASLKPMGPIVANRRSRIYAWPGCRSYDTMAPQNRVVFPSSQAAEQAGYRGAYNCP